LISFYVHCSFTPSILRSFPTRRSSDLAIARGGARLFNADLASTLEDLARRPERMRELYAELAREMGPAMGGLMTERDGEEARVVDRKSTRLNSSHVSNSYAVICLEKKM